jgi:hypothetical protein
MRRKLIFLILFLILSMMFIQSCKKDEYEPGVHFTIYLDNQYRIIKIIDDSESTTLYQYTDSTVKESDSRYRHTYYLNDNGLADSCLIEVLPWITWLEKPFMVYFKYNQDGWEEEKGYMYKYADGNRTEAIQDSTFFEQYRRADYYSFTSIPNIIDLEHFRGTYLGKYNNNLISKLTYSIDNQFKDATVEYSYILDKKNYVVKRTEIHKLVGMPTHESIITYKYIFVDQ